jgi:hypothetical protein
MNGRVNHFLAKSRIIERVTLIQVEPHPDFSGTLTNFECTDTHISVGELPSSFADLQRSSTQSGECGIPQCPAGDL